MADPYKQAQNAAGYQAGYGNSIATAAPQSAAQAALSNAEDLRSQIQTLNSTLASLAERLGTGLDNAKQGPANVPRPVRSGIIGAITEVTEQSGAIVQDCHELMRRIEVQI